jgi:hypothetical protein
MSRVRIYYSFCLEQVQIGRLFGEISQNKRTIQINIEDYFCGTSKIVMRPICWKVSDR